MDFDTVLITDSRIEQITDRCTFGIKSGASSSTYQSFEAVSKSTNTITHNVNVPSESIVVDRNISILTRFSVNFEYTQVAELAANVPNTFPFLFTGIFVNSFPFNSSVNTIQCNINNTSLSINLNDLKPFLMQLIDKQELQKYNGLCPTLDPIWLPSSATAKSISDSSVRNIDVDKTFKNSYVNSLFGNSSLRVISIAQTSAPITNGVITITDAGIVLTATGGAVAANSKLTFNVVFETVEPIMISPFIFNGNSQYNNAGLVGINTFNMVFNLDSSLSRVFRINHADTPDYPTITLLEIPQSQIQCCFLSLQPSQLIQSKNSVPYIDYPRYITSYGSGVDANKQATIISNSLQLNQIPDYLLIGVRTKTNNTTNPIKFIPISQVNINFNNVSGLLSSATEYDLYKMSVKNGLQKSWPEYSGTVLDSIIKEGNGVPVLNLLPTSGSIVVIDPSLDLSLPDFYSNGSIGVFSLQVSVVISNRSTSNIVANNLELVIVCCNTGIFNTVQGSSNTNSGVLNKEIVMNTKSQQSQSSMSSSLYQRLVGGSLSNSIGSAMRKIAPTRANVVASSSSNVRSKPFKGGLDQFV